MSIRFCFAPLLLAAVWPCPSLAQQPEPPSGERSPVAAAAHTVEVEFADEGQMRVVLDLEVLELESPYGKLKIPVEEIRRITPVRRVDPATQAAIDKAIEDLASPQFATREAASKTLASLQERAYTSLLKASKHSDPEVARHARELIARLKSSLPEERLDVREFDLVETVHSSISGTITLDSLPITTSQFGKQSLRLADIRSLRSLLAEPADRTAGLAVETDPGSLSGHRAEIGKRFNFRVTGRVDGTVYGTNVYTTDSTLATAAVHCGALKAGETGVVQVTIVPSPPSFTATSKNGVTSYAWGVYPAAYQIHVPRKK